MLSATDDLQPSTSSSASPIGCSQPCRPYNIHEILFATNFFDNSLEIGHGGYGKVYKGKLFNGIVAAIKRLDPGCGESQFWAEVETLSKLRHCNLVSLIGYCSYEDEMILVYEYMRFGTLADNLHKLGTPFSWRQLLQICLDAARGLDYLHTGTGIDVGVMHRDVKTSNILLHESWAAKISDFGLSILGPTDQPSTYVDTPVAITHGYVDLDYYYTGGLTSKCDVYNFGVVLLEVLCRKRAVDSSLDREELVLVTWAQDCIRKGKLKHIVDSGIRDEISPKCLKRFVQIVERCLHNTQNQRPTMGEVVCSLESLLILQGWYGGRSIEVGVHTPEEWSHTCRHFEYPEILLATNNFDESLVLGRGGYGKVYKGNIINGSSVSVVAIKRLDSMSDQGATEFWAEVEMLSRVHHSHLVSLFGYCNYEEQMILVYEHMPNGTLDEHLHKLGTPLSWLQRLKICIGVARGLDYLHTGTGIDFCIIHRDVKPSNIILHESCAAKLSDFGLSMIGPMDHTYAMQDFETTVKGTFGYLDPHYILTRWLTRKTDVFAFGVVLLEVLCRKCAVDPSLESAHFSLVIWAKESINEGNVKDIVDSGIRDQISSKGLKKFVKIVQKCLHKNPKRRPTMAEVVVNLESVLTLSQPAGKTIFGRMVDKLSFPTNRQNSGISTSLCVEIV